MSSFGTPSVLFVPLGSSQSPSLALPNADLNEELVVILLPESELNDRLRGELQTLNQTHRHSAQLIWILTPDSTSVFDSSTLQLQHFALVHQSSSPPTEISLQNAFVVWKECKAESVQLRDSLLLKEALWAHLNSNPEKGDNATSTTSLLNLELQRLGTSKDPKQPSYFGIVGDVLPVEETAAPRILLNMPISSMALRSPRELLHQLRMLPVSSAADADLIVQVVFTEHELMTHLAEIRKSTNKSDQRVLYFLVVIGNMLPVDLLPLVMDTRYQYQHEVFHLQPSHQSSDDVQARAAWAYLNCALRNVQLAWNTKQQTHTRVVQKTSSIDEVDRQIERSLNSLQRLLKKRMEV